MQMLKISFLTRFNYYIFRQPRQADHYLVFYNGYVLKPMIDWLHAKAFENDTNCMYVCCQDQHQKFDFSESNLLRSSWLHAVDRCLPFWWG